MNVWVLEEEHGYNGAAVVGVFTTREIALAAIVWNEPCVTGFFLSKLAVDQIQADPSEEYIPRPFQPTDSEVTTNCPDAWTGPASGHARKLPAGDGPRS
ncbi:hypothetical protein [Hyphomicrobium sp. DY-1]|uniref:hypothetical protein n=1 Tax=Hyphomicrobium sp. DY-1 TaxID=3075650 RepID=UPI0039C16469